MERFDVLIVGGGPAGSSCAWRLQRAGVGVALLDKQAFPRDKPCAGWITPPVVEELELDVDDYRQQHVFQPITGFRVGIIGGGEVHTSYGRPVSFGIRRCEFDQYLLQRAAAPCFVGEPVHRIARRDGRWQINDRFEAKVLVGAGGHFCPVARRLGARKREASTVVARECEFEASADQLRQVRVRQDEPELYFCGDLAGYGWCFRKKNYLNIGLGRTDSNRLGDHLEHFRQWLDDRGRVPYPVAARFRGHAYQLYETVRPTLLDDGALLVGDAAGLAYPESGEGIRPAVQSGLIAADTLLSANGFDRDALAEYPRRLSEQLGPPRSPGITARLPAAWLHALAARLLTTESFVRHVVINRWFLRKK